jgi:DHA3 family macrolide efflux protein-like MFS transporter
LLHSEGELTLSNYSPLDTQNTASTPTTFSAEAFKESLENPPPPPEPPGPPQTVTYRDLLRNRNFRWLWLGQAITTFGSSFTRVAIPIYVYQLTGSYGQLGFSFFVSFLPSLLFGLFAGALVDRWDQRRTMIYSDILSSALLAILVASVLLPLNDTFHLGSVYAITFLTGILREMFAPARIAIFTEVVPEHELLTANSLDQSTTTFGDLMSYPLASLALSYLGAEIAFSIDAVTFLLSAVLIAAVKVQQSRAEPDTTSNILHDIAEGLTIINRAPLLRKIVILSLFVPFTFSLLATLQLPFAVDMLGSTEEVGFPVLEGLAALGVVVGTLALGRWGQQVPRWKLLAYGLLSYGAVVACMGLVPQIGAYLQLPASTVKTPWTPLLLLAIPLAFLQGVTNSPLFTCIRTVTQEETPRAMMGRVWSVIGVAASIGWASGALFTGLAEGRADKAIILLGLTLLSIGLFSLWWLRVPPSRTEPLAQPVAEQSF